MGWWGVVWRVSVLAGVFAAFLTLPAFKSHRDTIVDLLSLCPLYWFDDAHPSTSLHSIVRTSSDAVFSQEELMMFDGRDSSKALYLAILGSVYDVSLGRKHYGPDGSYGFFSGLLFYPLFINLFLFSKRLSLVVMLKLDFFHNR